MKLLKVLATGAITLMALPAIASDDAQSVSPEFKWKTTHGASLVEFSDGAQLACWYGSTYEKNADAQVYTNYRESNVDWDNTVYGVAVGVGERAHLGLVDNKSLGNCSLYIDENETVHMYYNALVSCDDEWQCAQVQYKSSSDRGQSWGQAKQITTPGFLTRSKPVAYKDGKIIVPIHLEYLIGRSYACILEPGQFAYPHTCIDTGFQLGDGEFMTGDGQIQPTFIYDEAKDEILVYMRDTKKDAVPYSRLYKGGLFGLTWKTDNGHTNLPNPDSAVEMVRDGNDIYIIHNNDSKSRQQLTLSRASMDNPFEFEVLKVLDEAAEGEQVSYASAVIVDGILKVAYTFEKDFIRYQEFKLSELSLN